MPTFYVFNPGMCDPSEWEYEKQECEARSVSDAASSHCSITVEYVVDKEKPYKVEAQPKGEE